MAVGDISGNLFIPPPPGCLMLMLQHCETRSGGRLEGGKGGGGCAALCNQRCPERRKGPRREVSASSNTMLAQSCQAASRPLTAGLAGAAQQRKGAASCQGCCSKGDPKPTSGALGSKGRSGKAGRLEAAGDCAGREGQKYAVIHARAMGHWTTGPHCLSIFIPF